MAVYEGHAHVAIKEARDQAAVALNRVIGAVVTVVDPPDQYRPPDPRAR